MRRAAQLIRGAKPINKEPIRMQISVPLMLAIVPGPETKAHREDSYFISRLRLLGTGFHVQWAHEIASQNAAQLTRPGLGFNSGGHVEP